MSGRKNVSKSSKPNSVSVNVKELSAFFDTFVEKDDPDVISMEGICQLGEELGMDPTSDIRLLVLVWKAGAKKPGQLSRDEFMKGFQENIKVSNLQELRSILPSFDPGFLDKQAFRDFYKFVFQFSREGTHKTIERETVLALLPMVLDSNRAPHLTAFMEYLQTDEMATKNPRITLDQWDSFLLFNSTVNYDLSDFEDNGAWPILLDDYVEWRKGPQSGK